MLHCYSHDNSRRPVLPPSSPAPAWLTALLAGDVQQFDATSCRIKNISARWLRLLLLLGGDIEHNPGPVQSRPMVQRGHLDTEAGFASSTVHNMRKAIEAFEAWLAEAVQLSLESVPSDNRISSLSLGACYYRCAKPIHIAQQQPNSSLANRQDVAADGTWRVPCGAPCCCREGRFVLRFFLGRV